MANEVEKRKAQAFDAIKQTFGTEDGKGSVNLFVEHHLEELPQSYWQQRLCVSSPAPRDVVDLLQLRSTWGKNDIEYFDFTLPGKVTNYVVSVHFDDSGDIDGITMES